MPIKPPNARPRRQANTSSDDEVERPQRADRGDPADTMDSIDQPVDRAAPVDAPVSRGADLIDTGKPEASIPDADLPERTIPGDPTQHDPTDGVTSQLDADPRTGGDADGGLFGGRLTPPTDGPGPDLSWIDGDPMDSFDQTRGLPDRGDPFNFDVSAPALPGADELAGRTGPPHTTIDGEGGTWVEVWDADTIRVNFPISETEEEDSVELTRNADGKWENESGDTLDGDDIKVATGVTPPDPETTETGGSDDVQTEMDRLEMRVNQVVEWFSGDDDTTTPTPTEDYAPDAPGRGPATIDLDNPEYRTDVGRRDGDIDWGEGAGFEEESTTAEYDGIDYGNELVEPDLDAEQVADLVAGDPMAQPDVDPVEHSPVDAASVEASAGGIEAEVVVEADDTSDGLDDMEFIE